MYTVTDGVKYMHTVNVDIFACINYGTFPKNGYFAQIYICVFDISASMWHYKSYFVYIFANIL